MKKELIQGFVENVNKYIPTIEQVVKENLGVDAKFEVKVLKPSHTTEQFVNLEEVGDATKKQMTATPLLKHLFVDATLEINCYFYEKLNTGSFGVDVRYKHPSGQNGYELLVFAIDFSNGDYKIFK